MPSSAVINGWTVRFNARVNSTVDWVDLHWRISLPQAAKLDAKLDEVDLPQLETQINERMTRIGAIQFEQSNLSSPIAIPLTVPQCLHYWFTFSIADVACNSDKFVECLNQQQNIAKQATELLLPAETERLARELLERERLERERRRR